MLYFILIIILFKFNELGILPFKSIGEIESSEAGVLFLEDTIQKVILNRHYI